MSSDLNGMLWELTKKWESIELRYSTITKMWTCGNGDYGASGGTPAEAVRKASSGQFDDDTNGEGYDDVLVQLDEPSDDDVRRPKKSKMKETEEK
jgi:hypothetical protein